MVEVVPTCTFDNAPYGTAQTRLLNIMLDVGIRSVPRTPLMGRSGHLWRMLSTHYWTVTEPGKKDLGPVDYFAAWAADILEAGHRAGRPHGDIAADRRGSRTVAPVAASPED